eukprot:scaffold680350_cov59-Prasinocladus_malaysianus.AAC.1
MDISRLRRSKTTAMKTSKGIQLAPDWLISGVHIQLLLAWVQAVLAAENKPPLTSLGPSLADGRVYCVLVSHYLPDHLRKEHIQ